MGRWEHDMHEIEVPGRTSVMKDGTYRIEESPLLVITWKELDNRKVARKRSDALMTVTAVVDASGKEDTTPRVMWMRSRAYEEFCKYVAMVEEFSDHGFQADQFLVHVTDAGEVTIHKG